MNEKNALIVVVQFLKKMVSEMANRNINVMLVVNNLSVV